MAHMDRKKPETTWTELREHLSNVRSCSSEYIGGGLPTGETEFS